MAREVDALTSSTLKHLRERWWDEAFTAFVRDTVQPRAGKQILDVGCGIGTAEVKLSRLRLSQMKLVGVDLLLERIREAYAAVRSHNIRVEFAVADACALPFGESSFDAVFCVAVLQHLREPEQAVREFARVTRPGGRIVAVEPDNSARYFYSSVDAGRRAYETAGRFFGALARSRGEAADLAVGPKLPALFASIGIEPLDVQLFPVSRSQLGAPPPAIWADRRAAVEQAMDKAPGDEIRDLGREYLSSLERYAAEAKSAGTGFVEIQHTMLFATVGQREG